MNLKLEVEEIHYVRQIDWSEPQLLIDEDENNIFLYNPDSNITNVELDDTQVLVTVVKSKDYMKFGRVILHDMAKLKFFVNGLNINIKR